MGMELTNYEEQWAWSIFQYGYPDYSVVPANVLRRVASHHRSEAEKIDALVSETN